MALFDVSYQFDSSSTSRCQRARRLNEAWFDRSATSDLMLFDCRPTIRRVGVQDAMVIRVTVFSTTLC